MSIFKNRSEINISSAKMLHENDNYPSVAHCAYYSCYQYMMYLWTVKMERTIEELKSICANKGTGTHTTLINEMKNFIELTNNNDKRLFNSLITQLKKIRLDSDYTEETIDYNNSKNCIVHSEDAVKILKKISMKNTKEILEYLSTKLDKFIIDFPHTKISAVIDNSDVVFIQVLPDSIYFLDENYLDWENKLMDDFLEKYPEYNISFLTDSNTFVNIKEWDLTFMGTIFEKKTLEILSSEISTFEILSFNILQNITELFSKNTNTNIKSIKMDDHFCLSYYDHNEIINFDFCNNNHKKHEYIESINFNNTTEKYANDPLTVNIPNIDSEIVYTEEVILAA